MRRRGMTGTRVAVVGAHGHGLWHRRRIAPMHDAGEVRLVALCDVAGVSAAEGARIPDGVGIFAEHRAMLREARPEVVIVCTPPHTHLPIAVDVLRHGADLLLEKPPVMSLAEHEELAGVLRETGRACQVGFQALGSAALDELVLAVRTGALGEVTGISAAAAWQRDDAYWRRSPWAGHRSVNGSPTLDGVLVNACAHAVMQALAVAVEAAGRGGAPVEVELERYRARAIEVEDTASVRITLHSGLSIVVALTLCAEEFIPGEIEVHGSAGSATLEYPTDRLRLPGEPRPREVPGRVGLLENLLEHRRHGAPLVVPLQRTAPFTAVLAALTAAPAPERIDRRFLEVTGGTVTVSGVNAAVRAAAARLALFSELGVAWAAKPHRVVLGGPS
jgi:predicted dehydrogenase